MDIVVLGIIVLLSVGYAESGDTFKDHPCRRECVVDQPPMTCEYTLHIEWYWVLSKACYNCPFNVTDCYREECVSADGNRRALLTYNRQLPGPSIEVCEGDKIIAWVKNGMMDAAATSVHWHGQHQINTPFMDGLAYITQCAIEFQHQFRYEFTVNPVGTHWYHSHVGYQLTDGLVGSFIVRQPKEIDPNGLLYDMDLPEHVIMISDWMPMPFISRFMDQMHDRFNPHDPISGLINGRASMFDVKNDNSSIPDVKTPPAVFEITSGLRYRFRVIGASSACQFQMSIDDHMMTLITNDGMPVKPLVVDTFIITPGERYDIIVEANQTIGSYYMRAIGLGDCDSKTYLYAIVRYKSAPIEDPVGDYTKNREGILFNKIPDSTQRIPYGYNHSQVIGPEQLQYGGTVDTNFTEEVVDVRYYISMFYSTNDNTLFNNKLLYPVKALSGSKLHVTPVMDNITFTMPPIPILTQPEQVDESWFCNRSSLADSDRCLDDLCICTHLVRFQLGQLVELVVINEGSMFATAHHPIHLHGYNFRIMGIETFPGPINLQQIEQMDKEGLIKRNFINPPLRDTVMLPARSVAILRFKADNPGYWFFHCHVDGHLVQGKAVLFKIGDVSDFPSPPKDFPRCGGYGYNQKPEIIKEIVTEKCTSRASHVEYSIFFVFTFLVSCFTFNR